MTNDDLIETLKQVLKPRIEVLGMRFYGCEWGQMGSIPVLRVYIDGERGVTVGNCQMASREILAYFEVEGILAGKNYRLEVSSPGVERPLFEKEHYEQQIGKKLQIKLRAPIEGQKNFKGRLMSFEGEQVLLEVEQGPISLPYIDILKANVVFEG